MKRIKKPSYVKIILAASILPGTVFIASCAHSQTLPATQTAAINANAPVLATQLLSTPVRSVRSWSTALAPNARGGWNFITQVYEYQYGGTATTPAEYVVLDLQTGKYVVTPGRPLDYTNSNYQWDTQARAANGRIFFAEKDGFVTYYDPTDEQVHDLGHTTDAAVTANIYRWAFGPDGMLYGGTQSKGKEQPEVVQINPVTLQYKLLGHVGEDNNPPNYAYYLASDPTPSPGAPQGWVYVAVGENPWKLAALNIATGQQKILATRADAGWMNFDYKPEGIKANLITGLRRADSKTDSFWLADGQMYPYDPKYDPAKLPFTPRKVQPLTGPISNPPQLDLTELNPDSDGIGRVFWRPAGSKDDTAWKETPYKVHYTSPVALESLITLPDGTLLGNAVQYHGFFRYDPPTQKTTFYGAHGPSGGPRVVVDGKVYICGYPLGVLYVYDPTQPWTATGRMENLEDKGKLSAQQLATLNPSKLGNFSQSDAHYAYFLIPSSNGRLYFGGRRERDATGGAVGWYDPKTQAFAGAHENLSFLTPRGMLVLDNLQRIVFSGQLQDDPEKPGQKPAKAQLVVYDMNLKELERLTVKPGLQNTGWLYPAADKNQIIGVLGGDKFVYRYDMAQQKLLDWIELPANIDKVTQRDSDGSLWIAAGGALLRLDPATMNITTVGKLRETPNIMDWDGNDLYATVGADVKKIDLPGN